MGNIALLVQNSFDGATVTGGSWVEDGGLSLDNLKTTQPTEVARSSDMLTTSTTFDADLGAPKKTNVVALVHHNGSQHAQWSVQIGDDPDFNVATEDTTAVVASTNEIRNNTMVGAVALPDVSEAYPTNWTVDADWGGIDDILDVGTENGMEYIEVRLNGTPSGRMDIIFEANNQIAALQNENWVSSVFIKLVSGDLTNVDSVRLRQDEYSSAPAFLSGNTGDDESASVTSTLTRLTFENTLDEATAAFVQPKLSLAWTAGAVDLTLRIYLPQMEEQTAVTPVIKTSTVAVARTARSPVQMWDPFETFGDRDWGVFRWGGKLTDAESADFRPITMHYISAGVAGQYVRVQITDTTSTEAAFDIGRVYIAPVFQPTVNAQYGLSNGFIDPTIKRRSRGSNQFIDERTKFRILSFLLSDMKEDVAYTDVQEIMRQLGFSQDLLCITDPDDETYRMRQSIYGTFASFDPITHEFFDGHAASFVIEELV